jgi:selenocysteine lyase/cysteine desulfurase
MSTEPLGCQRDRFDLPEGVTYLNCAYMGPLSQAVVNAGKRGLERKARPWTIGPDDFFDGVEHIRNLFAEIVNADADGVAILPAASYGVAVAAKNLVLDEGGTILVLEAEFPSNFYAWREKALREDGSIETVRRPADGNWTDAVLERIDDSTNIIAIPHCHWTDGTLCDLVRIGERARDVGAALVLDATQSIGAMPLDVAEVRPDFVITAVYKWLLAPYGAAVMWCAPEHRDGEPIEYSWITRKQAEDFPTLVDYRTGYRAGARRYDAGQTSNFSMVPAIETALAQTLEWTIDGIASYTRGLTGRIAEHASRLGLEVAPTRHRSNHLIGVRLKGSADPVAISRKLAEADIFVSVRGDSIRVAPHVYNDGADVDRLFETLESAI